MALSILKTQSHVPLDTLLLPPWARPELRGCGAGREGCPHRPPFFHILSAPPLRGGPGRAAPLTSSPVSPVPPCARPAAGPLRGLHWLVPAPRAGSRRLAQTHGLADRGTGPTFLSLQTLSPSRWPRPKATRWPQPGRPQRPSRNVQRRRCSDRPPPRGPAPHAPPPTPPKTLLHPLQSQ